MSLNSISSRSASWRRRRRKSLVNEIALSPEKSYLWIVWFNISMQFWGWLKNNKFDWIQQPEGNSRTLSIIVSRGQMKENLDVPFEQSPQKNAQLSQFRWIDEFDREKYLLFHLFFSVKAVGKQNNKSITIYKIK